MIRLKKNIKSIIFAFFISCTFLMNVEAKPLNISMVSNTTVKKFEGQKIEDFENSGQKIEDFENSGQKIEDFEIDKDILCEGKFGEFLKQTFHFIKFAVPIIIIALSIMDFVKAIVIQDEKELKKASNKLVKRMIIGAIIFVLPTLIDYLLEIADINSSTCGW